MTGGEAWVVAAVASCAAAWLLTPGPVGLSGHGGGLLGEPDGAGAARRSRWRWVLLLGVPVGVAGVGSGRSVVVVVVIGAAAVAAAARVWRGRAASLAAATTRDRVIELCEVVQLELAAGRTPAESLELAATDWPLLEPTARTARAGGDVPASLRGLAGIRGAEELRVVAAAWQVAHRTGHGLADALGRVAAELRAAEATRRIVVGELASARATARLVAALPLAALVLGTGAGSNPWAFLLGGPPGWLCLAGGLTFGLAGLAWIEALATGVERGR